MKVKDKLKRILILTGPLLLYGAGKAFAAASGVAQIDVPLNTMGHVAMATGYIVGGIGAIGIIHHIRSGSWLGAAEHLGLATFGGAVVYNYPTIAPSFGGTAAALIHPATAIINHPALPAIIHALSKLVG